MANDDQSDDEARRRSAGRVERLSNLPKLVLGTRLGQPLPRNAPELDSTPPEPIVVKRRLAEQRTQIGGFEPAPNSAPMPPRSLSPAPTPRVDVPWAPVAPPSERSPLPAPAQLPVRPSLMAAMAQQSLPKLLALLAAAATATAGVVTAIGTAASQIITALKPSYEREQLKRELEAEIAPIKARADADWGLADETRARQAKEKETAESLATLRSDVDALKKSTPQIQGLVPPKR